VPGAGDILATMVVDTPGMTYDLTSVFPTLGKAPITEALIDIQVQLPPEVDLAQLRKFHNGLEKTFPKIDERVKVSATLQMSKTSGAELKSEGPTPDGWLMRSETDGLVVQARLDGFTLNKLPPYITWKSLNDHAKDLWQRYFEIARPTKVTRLAARYTNKIEMPAGVEFKQSILTVPEVAPGIPQGLPEYFMRLVIPHPSGAVAIVTAASLPTPPAENVAMLFDIDVSRYTDISPTDGSQIWSILEELRAYKNVIFFNSITSAQLEKYK
jgi:uncharacterized protein (TIGR04255 family)